MILTANDNLVDALLANSEPTTGIAALQSALADLNNDDCAPLSAVNDLTKFIARCADATGVTVKVDDYCADRIQTISGGFDILTWDGDYLLDPINKNPISGCYLEEVRYSARSGKLTLNLDEGEVITITLTGLSGAQPKPIKIPLPKSDIAGIPAIDANIAQLSLGINEIYEQDYIDTDDHYLASQVLADAQALEAFKAAMTTGHVAVNDKGPIPFDAAVQWNKKRLYVMGKRIWPEAGNIQFDAPSGTLTIYEADRDRQTFIQIVAAPEVLPLAA